MRDLVATSRRIGAVQSTDLAGKRLELSPKSRPAFDAIKDHAGPIYIVTNPLVIANRIRINTFALAARLPTMHGFRDGAEAAGPISYGASQPDQIRRADDFVDMVLRRAKVEQPTKFDLVINLTTAKALGITIPQSFPRACR